MQDGTKKTNKWTFEILKVNFPLDKCALFQIDK